MIAPQDLVRSVALDQSGAFQIDAGTVLLRPYPFPYRAALAISNDCDSMTRAAFEDWHAFVNGAGPTPYGDGLSLEVGDSFWIWSGPRSFELAIHRQFADDQPREDTPDVSRIVELSRAGFIDTIHSLGNWPQDYKSTRHDLGTREQAEYALAKLDALGVKPYVFVNHSFSPSNVGSLWSHYQKADDPTHPFYHMDLLRRYGFRYFWLDQAYEMRKFGDHLRFHDETERDEAINRFNWAVWQRRRSADDRVELVHFAVGDRTAWASVFNRTITPVPAGDGTQMLLFKRWRGQEQPHQTTFGAQVRADDLDQLERQEGAIIVYQHFGVQSARGRQGAFGREMRRPAVPPVLDRHAVGCWRDIAERYRAGRLFVATTGRLLNWVWLHDALRYDVDRQEDQWIVNVDRTECVSVGEGFPEADMLNGLAFLVPASAPAIIVTRAGRRLEMHREPDPVHAGFHAVYRPWQALVWPE